jgi:Protein of unknown function (DUF4242)
MPHVQTGLPPYLRITTILSTGRRDEQEMTVMPKYLIERTVPGAGQMGPAALAQIAEKSNEVLATLAPRIQWVHSYVSDDRITCIYIAVDEDVVREHARCGGFPVDAVHRVSTMIDPTTPETAR